MFGAMAAYAAVLVVFISGSLGGLNRNGWFLINLDSICRGDFS